ncbi:glycosyl transferase [Cloacibacterium rupense]|uniref:Glycosyl transferase n=1 Tax=Cloacibacterium rupense TaxID=517423 RepID=A0ABQ2NMX8_9FLAO|nr:glycosyltransferase family 2 protein [Cloacibacterium rupense]GGP06534.1 glycosyl transferase [Cloacibacterium rupense]
MKISIITVCYNSGKTIEDTFKSVQSQSYKDIEYIVIDGGSKDNTLQLINQYKEIIDYTVSEKDKGLYDAMNKGIEKATGDVIGFLNSDDLFCDDKAVEKVMNIFNENPKLDSVYADLYYVDQNNADKIVRKWITSKQKKFKYGWHPAHPTFYIKKEVYNQFGGFDLKFKLASDFEIMLRFLEKYKISTLYLPQPLIKMRLGGETNKSLGNIFKQNKECIEAFKDNDLRVNTVLYPFFRIIPKFFQYLK